MSGNDTSAAFETTTATLVDEEQQSLSQGTTTELPPSLNYGAPAAVQRPDTSNVDVHVALGDVTIDAEEDVMEMNAREQELLVNIQELQRQLSMVQIQTDKPQEKIVPPLMDARHRLIMVSNRLPATAAPAATLRISTAMHSVEPAAMAAYRPEATTATAAMAATPPLMTATRRVATAVSLGQAMAAPPAAPAATRPR